MKWCQFTTFSSHFTSVARNAREERRTSTPPPTSLICDAHSVLQYRRRVGRDRNRELRGPRRRLRPVVRRAQDLPRSADRLIHLDGDRHCLVIAQRDSIFELV